MPDQNFLRLASISGMIAEGLPRQEVFRRIVESVGLLGFDRVCLEMLSEDGAFLEPVAGYGFPENGLGSPIPACEDSDLIQLRADPRPQLFLVGSGDAEEEAYKRGCIPVLLGEDLVGRICVENSASGKKLDQEALKEALHFAHQAAIVRAVYRNGHGSQSVPRLDEGLTSTKAPQDAKLSAESLETLRETTLAITSMRGRDELLKIIVEQSVKLLKAQSGGLYEYRPKLKDLKLLAEYNRPENIGETLKLGEGMAGRLIGTDEPCMVIADYHKWEGEAPIYRGKDIFGSVLAVPLRWEKREIGVLYVDDEVNREFSDTDIQLLRLFADHAAISLINSELLERDERQLRRLEQLAEATREMMGNLDKISLRGRLDLIARQATEILDSETAGVFLVREEELVLEASYGHVGIFTPGDPKLKIIDEPHSGLTGAIAARGKVYCKNGEDLLSDPAYAGQISSHTRSGKCYSLLAIPLIKRMGDGGKSLVGLLRADNKKGLDGEALPTLEFTPEDVSILSIFAEAAVVAIESAELMEFRRGLIASSPNGIVAIDRKGRITELNRRAGEILGYEQDDVPNLTVYDLYMDDEEPKRIGNLLRNAKDHQLRDYDTNLRSKSQEPIPVRHASALLLDEEDRRVGSVGYFEDLRRESLWLEASTVLAGAKTLDEGLQQLATMIASKLGRSFCGILLMEGEEAESMVLRAEFLRGAPGWTPQRQRIFLEEWERLPELLHKGKPWVRERSDPRAGPMLKKLSRHFGLTSEIEVLLAVPLKIGERIVGQLDLGDLEGEGRRTFSAQEIGLVSALASQVTVLIDRFQLLETKERYFVQLATLHRISEHIQGVEELEQILHPVLTGITARYGLGFNRAILMLVDEAGESLQGAMGIGQLEDQEAREIWKSENLSGGGLDAFEAYLRLLQAGEIKPTIIGVRTRELGLLIGGEDVFSEVVREGKLRRIKTEEMHRVPQHFRKTFRVSTPVAVAPLVTQGRVIGVLVVDNKFTQAPIGDELCEALMTFASTAAGAIERKRLLDQIRSDRAKLQSFFELSGELVPLQKPREILTRIVAQAKAAAGASWVTILLIDKAGRARNPLTSGVQIRPDGISRNVMKTGRAEYVENTKEEAHRINERMIEKGYQAAICLPLSLTGRRIGVMWLHYDQPRRFPESEVAALQLYGGQAAVAYESARRIETLGDMREASTALAEAENLSDVSQQIVDSARKVFKADAAMLWPYDAEQKQFIPAASAYSGDHPAAWHELRQASPRSWGTAFHIMISGWMPVEDVNVPELGERVGDTIRRFLFNSGGRSFQGLALKVGRDMLGVLYAIYKSPSSFGDEEDKETALAFATRAALALKKAKLLGQVQRAQEAAQAVARITLLEEQGKIIDSIAQEISKALDCSALVIFQYDEDTKTLVHPPAMVGVIEPGRAARSDDRSGDSLVLDMLERHTYYPAEDVTRDEKFRNRRFARDEGVKSCIAFPLKAAGRKVGVLFINYRNPHHFAGDELTRMQLFANQAAVAIRNAQLFAESATKLEQQEKLGDLSRKLLSAQSVQETLDLAAEFAAAALGTDLCNIVLPDDEGRLIFSAGYGWKRSLIGRLVLPPGLGSQTGYTIQKKRPVAVYDYRQAEFDVPKIVFHYRIRSGLSVPMFRGEEIVGAMLVHTRRPRHFNREDETLLRLIANQTAIALERAQQYEASFRKSAYLEALEKASRAIAASFGVERPSIGKMIEEIAKPSMSTIVKLRGPGAVGAVLVYDESDESLVFQSLHSPERHDQLVLDRERRYIRKLQQEGGKIGITGRAWLTGRSQLVKDVKRDPDYDVYLQTTRSELAVPILDRDSNNILGVLNVESDRIAALDEEDQKALEALAELVVLAIQNARQFSELREAKLLVNTRTTLAWMGISNAVRRHEMSNYVGIIRSDLALLGKELKRLRIADEHISRTLDRIERMARAAAKMDRSLSGRADAKRRFLINKDLVQSWNRRFKPGKLDPPVQLRLRCELPDTAMASANVFWLKQVLDILVNNAIEATRQMSERIIVLGSRRKDSRAEVYVSDNGTGIPEPVRNRLFREPIEKPKGAKGLGMGLLVAHAIVQIYDGSMYIDDKSGGTTLAISLPLEWGT